ncbi:MAG TPA: hypothetical protein VE912_20000 [Bacteroidales bacterium]|nr:hypothetical protein [Bacteroidales bacterium]
MKSQIILFILLFSPIYTFGQHYSSWNNYECNDCMEGLTFKIKYPSDWISLEPDHYGLLCKFRPEEDGVMFVISVKTISSQGSESEIKEFLSPLNHGKMIEEQLKKVSSNYLIYDMDNFYVDNNYAIISDYAFDAKRLSGIESRYFRTYDFMYKQYYFMFQGVLLYESTLSDGKLILESKMKKYKDTFDQIANSVIIKRE